MTLGDKQRLFSYHVAKLLLKAYDLGYEVTLGEAWRNPKVAEYYAKEGIGISKSLHISRLAIDLNLFKDGKYLKSTEAHRPLGEWWEQQDALCVWGGRFTRPDGNHYAMTHGGRK
jgi:hypothetical protein